MEDEDLDELANLIDDDDNFDSDDEFIAQLNKHQDENVKDSASDNGQDASSAFNDDTSADASQNTKTSPENMAKTMSEMQKYIKFLETQLKTQNDEKRKSPENRSQKEDNLGSGSTTKKLSNQSTPIRDVKDENSANRKPSGSLASTSQTTSDVAFTKKSRVAHAPKTSDSSSLKNERKSCGVKRKAEELTPRNSSAKKPAQDPSNGVTEGFSGLRILNPLVSSTVMERRMEGRKLIKISSIQNKIRNNDIEGDWVTIGVLIQKLPGKTTAKGEPYSIWKLSDLAFNLQTSIISLFLFGENHKEHWKTVEGSVVALLNPSILPPREKQASGVALSLDNPKKLMMLGISQDFGVCQSARKSDGARCSNFINKSEGDFCVYHVRREYTKKRAKRMECQQGYGAPSKIPGNHLKQKVASEMFFYQGAIVTCSPAQPRKAKVTLKNLASSNAAGKDHLDAWKAKQSEKKSSGESSTSKEGPSEDFLSLLNIPTMGSRNLKLHLDKAEEEKELKEMRPVLSASAFLKANKVRHKKESASSSKSRTQSTTEMASSKDSPKPSTPVLGRGLNFDDDVFFDENVPLNMSRKSANNCDKAKRKAVALVRRVGPFEAKDPNDVRKKKTSPKLQDAIRSQLESDEETVTNSGKTFSLADGFDLDSAEGQRILNARSRHVGEVREAEREEEEAYFTQREKKEEMEAKMLSIKEMKVKVVHCLQCKYVAEGPGAICKKENHELKSLHVMKKFFSCRDCGERTVAYDQRYPTHECRKCGAKNYEKCSMWKEKSGPKIGGETLLLRGPEYAKFFNSLQMPRTNGVLPKYL